MTADEPVSTDIFFPKFFPLPLDKLYPMGYNAGSDTPMGIFQYSRKRQNMSESKKFKDKIDAAAERVEAFLEAGGTAKQIVFLAVSALSLMLSLLREKLLPGIPFDPAWIAVILCGIPIVIEALLGLITSFDITAGVLVAIALVASVGIGETFAAGEVAFIMALGEQLEALTVRRAKAGIRRLAALTPRTARLLCAGEDAGAGVGTGITAEDDAGITARLSSADTAKLPIIDASAVKPGDLLRVLPGETVPADGVIISGSTTLDTSAMTGEPLPAEKTAGDEVISGSVNRFGAFDMRAVRAGEDSSLRKMIALAESADASKAKIVGIADRTAAWIVIAALAAAIIAWAVSGEIIRAVTVLVVFCPCSLVLATPAAVMAAAGNASRMGFLTARGDALERLSSVRRAAFDKTGTLTLGAPAVSACASVLPGLTDGELLRIAASAESLSEHPLGRAIAAALPDDVPLLPVSDFAMTPGVGISASVDGRRVWIGSATADTATAAISDGADGSAPPGNIESLRSRGATVVRVMFGDGESRRTAGYIALSDSLRPESAGMISALKTAGVVPVLLTGDSHAAAHAVAAELGIDKAHVHASCLPADKLKYVSEGEPVCMTGDGINDAPALRAAHVGIAIGSKGMGRVTDIAAESADILLTGGSLAPLPRLFTLSRRMMNTIRFNIIVSMVLNFAAVTLALMGVLGPVAGALIHNAGALGVILNSAALYSREIAGGGND